MGMIAVLYDISLLICVPQLGEDTTDDCPQCLLMIQLLLSFKVTVHVLASFLRLPFVS
jgi:hypothetical protein